jgi:Peptidase family M23
MFSLFVIPVVLQIAVPIVLLVWQAAGRDTNLISWFLKHGAVWCYIYATSIAGVWLIAPWYLADILLVISISLAARRLAGALTLWRTPANVRQWLAMGTRASAAVIAGAIVSTAVQGGKPPEATIVDLSFPLRSGHYYIANGGSANLVNAHLMTLGGDRFRAYRGQSYGIDIVELNAVGVHATWPAPHDPGRYKIFGEAIYAPCNGIVARSEDGLPDLSPPHPDRANMAGNYVLVECGEYGDFHVLLGHMRSGSVKVHPGDYVTTDTLLGEVGNSGNSNEPHLHVHAQRPGRPWDPFAGDPLHVSFDGRYLARNDRITISIPEVEIIDD